MWGGGGGWNRSDQGEDSLANWNLGRRGRSVCDPRGSRALAMPLSQAALVQASLDGDGLGRESCEMGVELCLPALSSVHK